MHLWLCGRGMLRCDRVDRMMTGFRAYISCLWLEVLIGRNTLYYILLYQVADPGAVRRATASIKLI